MSDTLNQTTGAQGERKQEKIIDLRPTLFIGVGGTGMQVLMRVRRRILNTLWGSAGRRTRVESLTEFPVAQFIHFDLDNGSLVESGESQAQDLQFDLLKFTDDEKLVDSLDAEKYSRDDDSLERYPHIKEWLPLTPQTIRDLNFDMKSGAGQVRAVSRLYFFDKYGKVRDKIRLKLKTLKAGLSHERQLSELGLRMEPGRFRIVVVGSVAGGTGSGSFLDMGYLARWIAETEVEKADVELMLFLPSGYTKNNKDRVEGNGYAALMELESAMLGNQNYLSRWDSYDRPQLTRTPYNEVFLLDSGNLAQQHTDSVDDIYHMVADSLFEDFASADFARAKRSIAVNQAQHKNSMYRAPVPQNRFGDMRLYFSQRYSSFGMAVLDTRQEAARDERAHRWAGAMLKAFFGVGGVDAGANRANDGQRDQFIASHMSLRAAPFNDFPVFSDRSIELKRSNGPFDDYQIVDELLAERQGSLLSGVEERVNRRVDDIRTGYDRKEWPAQLREAVRQLERDAVRDQDSTADTTEDRIAKRRAELFGQIRQTVRDQLYGYLDNKEFGGLEYVLSLVEQIKDRIEAPGSGLLAQMDTNAERYREIKEAVRSREYERLLNNLEQTRGGFFGSGEKQASVVMDHLRIEIANALKFHLRARAAEEAVQLLRDLSRWLGNRTGVDNQGRPVWNGLVGELQAGRAAVLDMLNQLQTANVIVQKDLKKDHATAIVVPVTVADIAMPSAATLREWADDAFKDIGGSKTLFPMLGDAEQRGEILNKVKRMAENRLAVLGIEDQNTDDGSGDPLFVALDQMEPARRQDYFRKMLACAMPWIDANMAAEFTVAADQYKCVIGVAGALAFKKRFGAEINACVQTQAGITSSQVDIVETGNAGRAVCYCELAGVPLTVLRGLEGWRTSYRKESDNEKAPIHTHIDTSQFNHPIAPSTDEIRLLAEHFSLFLKGIMLGMLTRHNGRVVPLGQYLFVMGRGDVRRVGNERAIRQSGLHRVFHAPLESRVAERLAELDAMQTVALSTLAQYYADSVYTPRLVSINGGAQIDNKGFGNAIASEIASDLRESARRKGMTDAEIGKLEDKLEAQLKLWATVIPDSDADAHQWEVRPPEEGAMPRLKFAIKPEMLEPGALQALIAPAPAAAPAPVFAPAALSASPFASPSLSPGLGLGAVQPQYQYELGINGQKHGPFSAQVIAQYVQAGQVVPANTKVWRAGMADWALLSEFAELAPLLSSASPALTSSPPLSSSPEL